MEFHMNWDKALDTIVTHAWETWTKNGLDLSDEMRVQTEKSVRDAATNVYLDGMSDTEWLQATLDRLGN